MNSAYTNYHNKTFKHVGRNTNMESEGALRVLLLAFALVMPMASMAYIKIQHTRFRYNISALRKEIYKQEELHRILLLKLSQYKRDKDIHTFAIQEGFLPCKQTYFVTKSFTAQDQYLAKLSPTPIANATKTKQ